MNDLVLPEPPMLPAGAVDLLTAILEHLDLPAYAEGDKQARRAWRDQLETRHADVVSALHDLLDVRVADAADHAAQLRRFATEEPPTYATWGGQQ
jgi:hypothetical protein